MILINNLKLHDGAHAYYTAAIVLQLNAIWTVREINNNNNNNKKTAAKMIIIHFGIFFFALIHIIFFFANVSEAEAFVFGAFKYNVQPTLNSLLYVFFLSVFGWIASTTMA